MSDAKISENVIETRTLISIAKSARETAMITVFDFLTLAEKRVFHSVYSTKIERFGDLSGDCVIAVAKKI